MSHRKPIIGLISLAVAGLAACGGSATKTSTPEALAGSAEATTVPASPAAPSTTVAVRIGDSKSGKILAGADGKTLYGFTNDADAKSTCYSACAAAWPPVIVGPQWSVGPGLDTSVFSTVTRNDGSLQLVAGKWPLYEYSGDAVPGDTNGQGSGEVWFVVGGDGKLVKAAPSSAAQPNSAYGQSATTAPPAAPTSNPAAPTASLSVGDTALGKVLVDAQGRTLYGLTKDMNGTPTCTGACAKAWPPALVSGDPTAGPGVGAPVTVVDAPGGGKMLRAGAWPLYRFSGDAGPGDVNGQGSGGVWFAVGADGKLIKH